MLNRLALTLITAALLTLGASGATLTQATPENTATQAGAIAAPAAYTPLLASQADVNALHPHDE